MQQPKLPPAIMIQGTASNAGKSVLTAALCRLLWRQGYAAAPFKAQNMSLNSWVTPDGCEMGIAQAVQARACGLAPQAAMNPVLLKPLGHMGSQVILNGKPLGTMQYKEYIKIKSRIWIAVKKAYAALAQDKDVMLLEGAGSPAEINLRSHDIVNMRMAAHAGARVILTADIDCGGAFAALAGTMQLLGRSDRRRVAAFCLNKFRGDASLLAPAIKRLEKMYKRPFIGIIPMLQDANLPEEDSVNLLKSRTKTPQNRNLPDIAVISLPLISNIGDWDALAHQANVRLITKKDDFGSPHLLILPGSRNVPQALAWLRQSGLDACIMDYASNNPRGHILGICAGLQILGNMVTDPCNVEGGGAHAGLGLLQIETILNPDKSLRQTAAVILPPLLPTPTACSGYEIHHGQITSDSPIALRSENGQLLGWGNENMNIWGTWLHGIFNSDDFRNSYLARICADNNLPKPPPSTYDLQAKLDKLADAVADNFDMRLLKSWLLPQQTI